MNPWGGRGPAIPFPRKRYLRAAAGRTNFPSAAPRARRQIFFWLLLLSAERGRVSTYGGNRYVAAAHSFFGNGPRCRRYVPRNVATPAIRRFRRITAGDLCGPGRLRPPTPPRNGESASSDMDLFRKQCTSDTEGENGGRKCAPPGLGPRAARPRWGWGYRIGGRLPGLWRQASTPRS